MQRRTFLGAAAALAALPTPAAGEQRGTDRVDEDMGTSNRRLPPRDVWSHAEIAAGGTDEDASLSVAGFHLDDEPDECGVEVTISTDSVSMKVGVGTDRARELAADLEAAADLAEFGPQD